MPLTSPDNIDYPDTSYTSGFVAAIAAIATSIQNAFNARQIHSYQWPNETARDAQTGMARGDWGFQADTATYFSYDGSAWNPMVQALRTGLVPIIPTSVSGTGVSVDASGLVTFSNAQAITLDGVFSSLYRNYRIVIESTGTAATLLFNLRDSTPADVTTLYDRTELLARNGSTSSSTNVGGSAWTIIGFNNTLIQADIDVSAPYVAQPTTAFSRAGTHANPAAQSTTNGLVVNYLTHRTSASYQGLKFTYSQNQSGTVRVYGYA